MAEASRWSSIEDVLNDPASTPLDVLRVVGTYQRYLDALEKHAVKAARATGATWEDIGQASGVTRQSAWQRFRHVEEAATSIAAQLREQQTPFPQPPWSIGP